MDTAEALAQIRSADTPELALYWLRLATAGRAYCADLATPTDARQATERAILIGEPAGFVAVLATGAERLHALLARVEDAKKRSKAPQRRWPDRVTAYEVYRAIGKPNGISHPTIVRRMQAHPAYELRTIGKRIFHTIPYSALEAIRTPRPQPRPEHLWTKQTRDKIAKSAAKRRRLEKARRARKIRRLARIERIRRERVLEAIRNPKPFETFSDAIGTLESHTIRALQTEKSERLNVSQVARALGVARSTARIRMKMHPDVKRIGQELTIPRDDVSKLALRPGSRKPKRDERKPRSIPDDRIMLRDLSDITGHTEVTLKKHIVLHPDYLRIGRFHTVPRKVARQFKVLKKLPKQPKAS